MYDSCTLRNGGCLASLPDNGCYWFRWFKDLIQKTENPWHTGTPTEEGWYLLAFIEDGRRIYDANRLKNGIWEYCLIGDILEWQKIEEKEK
jgi:hypothetical protein